MSDKEPTTEDAGVPDARAPLPPALAGQPVDKRAEPRWHTLAILAGIVAFLYLVRSILAPFVIAGMLAYVLSPVVTWIQERTKWPRPIAVALFLLAVLIPLGVLIWIVEPTLARETNDLVRDAPTIISGLMTQIFGGERIEVFGQVVDSRAIYFYLQRAIVASVSEPGGALRTAAVLVETLVKAFLSLVLLVYFLLDPRPFGEMALRLFPPDRRDGVIEVGKEIHSVLGRYVRGLAFLVALMATLTWLGLSLIFHLRYALPIAIATGFLEIIPFLGPVVSGAIAASVALSQGGTQLALGVIVAYLILRQFEDQLVMPVVLGHAVELHPAVNIFAVLAGTALWGVIGALLAIPVAAAVKVAFLHFRPN